MEGDILGLKKEIAELRVLLEENTRMTRAVYRQARFSTLFSVLKWVIIIGISIGSLYFIQPYLEGITSAYSTVNEFGNSASHDESIVNQLKDIYMPR